MSLADYEEIQFCRVTNMTQAGWQAPLLSVDFGAGREAGAFSAPAAGLHNWTLSTEVIPDLALPTIEFQIPGEGKTTTTPYFTYLEGFIKRHVMANNKPFIIKNPRTNKKYLVSFETPGYDFEQFTAKIFGGGGVKVRQRKVSDISFNPDGSVFTGELSAVPLDITLARNSVTTFSQTGIVSPVWTLDGVGTLNQSGQYTAPNSAGSAKIRVHTPIWASVGTGMTKQADDDVEISSNSGNYAQADSAITITNVGEYFEQIIASNNLTFYSALSVSQQYTILGNNVYYNSTLQATFSNPGVGQKIKFLIAQNGANKEMRIVNSAGTVLYTFSQFVTTALKLSFYVYTPSNVGVVFPCPNIVASGYTEYIANITIP